MIEVTYLQLINPMFIKTLSKLYKQHGFPFKTGYTLSKICPKLEDELKNAIDLRNKMAMKFGITNEDGSLMVDVESPSGIKIKEGEEENFKKELEEFLNHRIELQYTPLKPEDMEISDLSPMEWNAIAPILAQEEKAQVFPIEGNPEKSEIAS